MDNFLVSAVGAQVRNAPFSVTFTARDVNNVTIPTYAGTPALSATDGATSLTITPTTLSGFSSGVKTQSISINSFATNAVITATDPNTGGTGSSNAFAVAAGAVDHFAISSVPSNIPNGSAQPVTITAQDAVNNTVTSFNQTANLSISNDSAAVTSGTGTSVWPLPLGSLSRTQRMQAIYLPAEVGTARVLNNLALYVSTVPGAPLSNLTIRMKHSPLTSYSTVAWDSTGWTTVYQATATISATGWWQLDFATPFTYDGTSSLMIDFSYYNAATGTTQGYVRYTTSSAVRTVLLQTDTNYGSPLTWTGTTNPTPLSNTVLPNVRFGTTSFTVPVSPTITGSFTNGVWSGSFTPATAATSVKLRATNGSITGASNVFSIAPSPLVLTLPASASESAVSVAGSVAISAAQASDVVVSLSSNDITEAQPATSTVTIPAGSTSAAFTLNIINDTVADGMQTPTITASASGYGNGTTVVNMIDDDLKYLSITTLSGPGVAFVSFPVTVTARTIDGYPATATDGTSATFSSLVSGSSATVTPSTTTGGFSGGLWSGNVSLNKAGVATITATSAGVTGTSGAFPQNSSGTASRFIITGLTGGSQLTSGTSQSIQVRAADTAGVTDIGYSYPLDVTVRAPGMGQVLVGDGAITSDYPFNATNHDSRTQVIYTAAQLGGRAMNLTGLALSLANAGSIMNNFTIRLKHTTKTSFTGSSAWDAGGWVTVHQSNASPTSSWNSFSFSTPFNYNGTDNLMVDLSFDNSAVGITPVTRHSSAEDLMMATGGSNSTNGTPVSWDGSTTPAMSAAMQQPQLILHTSGGLSVSPSLTGTFTNGVWSGNIAMQGAAKDLTLSISDRFGRSGSVEGLLLVPPASSLNSEPFFTGGTSNTVSWPAVSGAVGYEVKTANNPTLTPVAWSQSTTATSATASP
ncbi:MAG: hypothetical protein B7Z47_04710, partial [Chthoniobacter sp. 12-60-6]